MPHRSARRGRGVGTAQIAHRPRTPGRGRGGALRTGSHAFAKAPAWECRGCTAEYLTAHQDFVYALPEGAEELHLAPLLCASMIGFRTLRVSGIQHGGALGMYGFGAAAHVAIQVARHCDIQVYAITCDARHRSLALDLGVVLAGDSAGLPPAKLDAALIFAPAGELVISALRALKRGTVALGGIHIWPSKFPSTPKCTSSHWPPPTRPSTPSKTTPFAARLSCGFSLVSRIPSA